MLPEPNLERVEEESARFDAQDELIEKTVGDLFARYPRNVEAHGVLAKSVVLNQLYSARVLNIHIQQLARHITKCDLDPLLDQGSPVAVDRIIECPDIKIYYSFATKYCSWHRPDAYPIWDRYVDETLWYYQRRYAFSNYQHQQVGDYAKWVSIVSDFKRRFGLEDLNFKKVDKFLWRMGDQLLNKPKDSEAPTFKSDEPSANA
jgi:hypothetical protein